MLRRAGPRRVAAPTAPVPLWRSWRLQAVRQHTASNYLNDGTASASAPFFKPTSSLHPSTSDGMASSPDFAHGRPGAPAPAEWTPPAPKVAVSHVDLPPGWRPLVEPTLLLQDYPADATKETLLQAFEYCRASSVDLPPRGGEEARVHFPTLDQAELALATLGGPGALRVAPPPGGVGRPKAGSDPAEWVTACTRIVYPLASKLEERAALWGLVRPAGPIRRLDIRKVHAKMALPPLPEEKEISMQSEQSERKKAALVQFHAPAAAERLKDMVTRWAQNHGQTIETYRYEQWAELQPHRRSLLRPSPRLGPSLIIDANTANAVPSTPLLAPTPLLGPREQSHPMTQKPLSATLDKLDEDVPSISIEPSLHKGSDLLTAAKIIHTASPSSGQPLAPPSKEHHTPVPEHKVPETPQTPVHVEPGIPESPSKAVKTEQDVISARGTSLPHIGLLPAPTTIPTPDLITASSDTPGKNARELLHATVPVASPTMAMSAITPAVLPETTADVAEVDLVKQGEDAKVCTQYGTETEKVATAEAAKANDTKATNLGLANGADLKPDVAKTETARTCTMLQQEHLEALPPTVREDVIIALLEKSVRAHLRNPVPTDFVAVGAAKIMATGLEDQTERIVRALRPNLDDDMLLKALTDMNHLGAVARAASKTEQLSASSAITAITGETMYRDASGANKPVHRVSATERRMLLNKVKAAFPSGSAAQCNAAVGALTQLPKQERRLILLSRQRLHQTLTKIEARTPWAFGSPPPGPSAQNSTSMASAQQPSSETFSTPTTSTGPHSSAAQVNGTGSACTSRGSPHTQAKITYTPMQHQPARAIEEDGEAAGASPSTATPGGKDAGNAAPARMTLLETARPPAGEDGVRYFYSNSDDSASCDMAGSALARHPALAVAGMVRAHLADLARGGAGIRAPFENECLWLAGLERYSVPDQKQAVGDRLFPLVKAALGPDRAGARRVSAYLSARCLVRRAGTEQLGGHVCSHGAARPRGHSVAGALARDTANGGGGEGRAGGRAAGSPASRPDGTGDTQAAHAWRMNWTCAPRSGHGPLEATGGLSALSQDVLS